MFTLTDWQEKMLATTVIYLMLEKSKKFSVLLEGDDTFVEPVLQKMHVTGLLEIDKSSCYVPTSKGKEVLQNAITSIDVIRQFNAFATVNVAKVLSNDQRLASEPFLVKDELYDPRFDPSDPDALDLRLALITWLCEVANNKGIIQPVDARQVVFLQMLGTGQVSSEHTFWFDLRSGEFFQKINDIVSNAYRWTDMDTSSKVAATECMELLYKAGITEIKKRQGSQCGGCESPLVLFEESARKVGKVLDLCPVCKRALNATPKIDEPDTFECPSCSAVLYSDDKICGGCGALIDYSLPIGTIETQEPVFVGQYDYCSRGWLNPHDPYADLLMFECMACAFW